MYTRLLTTLFVPCLSFSAFSAGLGFNPFQKPASPTSPGGANQKLPPVTAPAQNIQPSKPVAPVLAPAVKPEKQTNK
jgi:hypothetical protein